MIGHRIGWPALDRWILRSLLHLGADVRLPDDDVNAHRNPASIDRKLDPEAQENLRRWYGDDYGLIAVCEELFGN